MRSFQELLIFDSKFSLNTELLSSTEYHGEKLLKIYIFLRVFSACSVIPF